MVLGQYCYDPDSGSIFTGLNLLPRACIIPHHAASDRDRVSRLAASLPENVIIGISEQTGIIDDGSNGNWNIYGKGPITLYRHGTEESYNPGEMFSL